MGTKAPLAIVLISAVVTYTVGLVCKKKLRWNTMLALLGLISGSAFAYLILVQSDYQTQGLTFTMPIASPVAIPSLIFSFVTIAILRIPLLFISNKYDSDYKNLAIGAAVAGLGTFFFKSEGITIVYFLTGAIALATFYSGISSDLVDKTGCKFKKLVVVAGASIFFISLYLHVRKIYFSVLPKIIAGELAGDYEYKLQTFQNFLVVLFIVILFVTLVKTNRGKRIKFGLIVAMLATTFGLYIGDSLSTEIRQQAVGKYDLDGGTDDFSLNASGIIEATRWIKTNSKPNDIVATNYSVNGIGIPYLVSVASQKSVLLESNGFVFSTLFVKNNVAKTKMSADFFAKPNALNAKALTDIGVDWYLFATANSQTKPSVLCVENQIWRCEFFNEQSVVIRFLNQN